MTEPRKATVTVSTLGCVFWVAMLMILAALLAKWVLS